MNKSDPPDADAQVREALLALTSKKAGRTLTADEPLAALGIDSLALMDLVGVLEKRFDFKVDQDIMDVETLGELAIYISARRRDGH